MSAMGQKRTLVTAPYFVRFASEIGHRGYRTACPLRTDTRNTPFSPFPIIL